MLSACVLSHRTLIKIGGADKLSFIQGLVSNDMGKITPDHSLYTLLLSPQGRLQFDILAHQIGHDWFFEVDTDRAEALIKRLTVFKLRSNVTLDLVQDKSILSLWGENLAEQLELEAIEGAARTNQLWTVFIDPRLMNLGARLIITSDQLEKVKDCLGLKLTDLKQYNKYRYQFGVPEGAQEISVDRAIPLELGMDELNAIDWNKGCYMGQELTARTRYRGLVRKRVFPVTGQKILVDYPIMDGDQEVGQWLAHEEDIGLAMIRLSSINSELKSKDQAVNLLRPSWMKLPDVNDEA